MYAQLAEEVVDAVDKQIEGCASRSKEATPPPMVILQQEGVGYVLNSVC